MQLDGQKLEGPSLKGCKIMYNGKVLDFQFQAVLDFDEMALVLPEPQPDYMRDHPEGKERDDDNPKYLEKRAEWAQKKYEWMFLKSISVTKDLVWDTIDLEDPATWGNFRTELSAFLTEAQIATLLTTMIRVNTLTQDMMDEAEEHFLAERQTLLEAVCSHLVERCFTLNGEPVKDLDLFLEEFENDGMIMDLGNEP